MKTVECPTCEGVGSEYIGSTRGKWGDRWVPDDDYRECRTCNGNRTIQEPDDDDLDEYQQNRNIDQRPQIEIDADKVLEKGDYLHEAWKECKAADPTLTTERFARLVDQADRLRAERKDGGQ